MAEANTVSLQVHSVSSTFHEPTWLQEIREQAWQQFDTMPEPRLEKTDLRKRGWETGTFAAASAKPTAEASAYVAGVSHPIALFADGHLVELKVPLELAQQGVIFTDIHSAAEKHADLFKQYFATVVTKAESKWNALNLALFAGGIFLYVPRGLQLEVPFEVVHAISADAAGSYPRSLIVADELADVKVIETSFVASGRQKVTNSHVIEVVAKQGSRVSVATADELRKGPTYFLTRRAELHKDAQVEWLVSDVSDGFAVELVESVLKGAGAQSQTRVIGLGYGREHIDLTASMVHEGRNTESEIIMHNVLRDRANSIYRSRTEIVKGAVEAGSEQSDRMIMVDGTARADAIPMLLIDENDVKRCGHAASVGKIDPNQIYYLMSRGIPKAEATKMIIWGYLHESAEALPSESVRQLVTGRIERELGR